MKVKNISKALLAIMLIFSVFMSGIVLADGDDDKKGFDPIAVTPNPVAGKGPNPINMSDTAQTILGAIQWVGYAIAVGMLIYVGIKYVMASANEKADLKQALVKYVIGAVLIAGAATLANWIFNILT